MRGTNGRARREERYNLFKVSLFRQRYLEKVARRWGKFPISQRVYAEVDIGNLLNQGPPLIVGIGFIKSV
jgi:hypothetical protein